MTARNFTLFQPLGSFNLGDPEGYDSFKKNIAGQVQGEIVLFQEGWPAEIAALAFAVAYNLSDEVLIRLASGKIARLFKHSDESVAYPEPVDSGLAKELAGLIKNSSFVLEALSPPETLQVDLMALWNQTKQDEMLRRTLVFSKSLSAALKPAVTIDLIGEVPTLPLLGAIILARQSGRNIYYQSKTTAGRLKLF